MNIIPACNLNLNRINSRFLLDYLSTTNAISIIKTSYFPDLKFIFKSLAFRSHKSFYFALTSKIFDLGKEFSVLLCSIALQNDESKYFHNFYAGCSISNSHYIVSFAVLYSCFWIYQIVSNLNDLLSIHIILFGIRFFG